MKYIHIYSIEGGGWAIYKNELGQFKIHEFPQYGGNPQEVNGTFYTLDEAINYAEENLT